MSSVMSLEHPVREVSWPQAFLLTALSTLLIAGIVILVLAGKDVGAMMAVAAAVIVPILGAFGISIHQGLQQVKDVANGRLTDLLEDNKNLHEDNKRLQAQVTALALSLEPKGITPVVEATLPLPDVK